MLNDGGGRRRSPSFWITGPTTGKIEVLGRFFGGQGTVNVPCWSPDGRRIAFVTCQLIP